MKKDKQDKFQEFDNLFKKIPTTDGAKIEGMLNGFKTNLAIFFGNQHELLTVLQNSEDLKVGIKIHDQKNPKNMTDFVNHLVRMLFNYLSSSYALIEHSRKVRNLKLHPPSFSKDYDSKVQEVFGGSKVSSLIRDLRTIITHSGIPPFQVSLDLNTMENRILITKDQLRRWSRLSSTTKQYLDAHTGNIYLRYVIEEYGQLVTTFYNWLYGHIQRCHRDSLNEHKNNIQRYKSVGDELGVFDFD